MSKVLRDLKYGELTLKDMSVLRERGQVAREQVKKTSGNLTDYSLNHIVSMHWGKGFEEARRDLRPFKLRIDDKSFIISWGELKDMDSAGFFRKEKPNPLSYTLKYLQGHNITVSTDLNEEAQRDMIFKLSGKGFEVFLDWYEVMRYGRFI